MIPYVYFMIFKDLNSKAIEVKIDKMYKQEF